jgi:hypothetical protein
MNYAKAILLVAVLLGLWWLSGGRRGGVQASDEAIDVAPTNVGNHQSCMDQRRVLLHSENGKGHCILFEAIDGQPSTKGVSAKGE